VVSDNSTYPTGIIFLKKGAQIDILEFVSEQPQTIEPIYNHIKKKFSKECEEEPYGNLDGEGISYTKKKIEPI
jgi:hypothetical protein